MFSGPMFVGSLLRLTFFVFIVFGFVEGNEEPTCSKTLMPFYVVLGLLNVCLIGGVIFLSYKLFFSKGNKEGKKEEDKGDKKKEGEGDKKEGEEPKK
uniref:Uncharacterized protein n=1 Tax=Meloidogyne enterolobii TaxID=390850 RepID=A0A6V7U1W3_MELEN|nr:unnamed protein product [Meloidogyne enterolobii]